MAPDDMLPGLLPPDSASDGYAVDGAPKEKARRAAKPAPITAPITAPAAAAPAAVGLTLDEKRACATAYGFAKYFLKLPVYDGKQDVCAPARECRAADGTLHYTVDESTDWQKRVFDAMDTEGARVTLRTANGSGKTSTILTGLILWHMAVFPNSTVISTAGVDRQVRQQLYPSLRRAGAVLEGWKFNDGALTIEAPNGSRYIGFTTDKPERAEGWHGKGIEGRAASASNAAGPLMILVDESKGIPQGIFEAFDRCTYQRILYASSPGLSDGEFFKSQTAPAYPFKRFHIPARLCPHADHAKNAETIAKRGLDHPLVRSAIFGEFMTNEDGFVLTSADLDRCLNEPPSYMAGDRSAFCDFAAGGDENVIALREGNRVRIAAAWRERNTMAALGEFIAHFRRLGLRPEEISADGDGLGAPMLDRLAEMGWPLRRLRNGTQASEPKAYFNFGAETWFAGADRIKRREVILADLDDETRAQLLGRRMSVDQQGRLKCESKEDMRKRGLTSPDRADSLLAALRPRVSVEPLAFMRDNSAARSAFATPDHSDERDLSFLGGCSAGW